MQRIREREREREREAGPETKAPVEFCLLFFSGEMYK